MSRISYFEVEGLIQFPLDMLRYDNCWPDEQMDVINIQETLLTEVRLARRRENKLFRIKLATYSGKPTVERWKTFGWKVVK